MMFGLNLNLSNGWIFVLMFILVNVSLMVIFPKHYSQRLFVLPKFTSKKEFIPSLFYAFSLNGTFIYSIFVHIDFVSVQFFIGICLFLISFLCFITALVNYATTLPDKPVTKGIYKISRHPQQVFAAIMWVGCGLAASSWIIIALCVLQLILSYPTLLAQERFCIEKYGKPYEDYMKKTVRYFLFF